MLGRKGNFWQVEKFDRYIRNPRHYAAAVDYIETNPVRAGLCEKPEDWKLGGAGFQRAGKNKASKMDALPGNRDDAE